MNDTRIVSNRRTSRALLVLAGALLAALTLAGCGLRVAPYGVEAITPSAKVRVSPGTFCVGEILTVSYDGGPQVSSCGSPPDSGECKGGYLSSNLYFPELTFGYAPINLHGSLSGPADVLDFYRFTYYVEWEGWSAYRDYRQRGREGSGHTWTGRVQAETVAVPIESGVEASYVDVLVCDEDTHTWRFGRGPSGAMVHRTDAAGTISYLPGGELSACAAITQICISGHAATFPWRLSVEGGPSVVLGGPGNPVCTDAFEGYHPDDIVLEPGTRDTRYEPPPDWGTPCTPGDVHPWRGTTILTFDLAGSTMCTTGAADGFGISPSYHLTGIESYTFGDIELRGTARERCEAALDPGFLEAYRMLTTASAPIVSDDGSQGSEPGTVTICDLDSTCGDGACQAGCEDALNCAQDCEPSEANCPPGTYYAPATEQCIAIQIPEPKKERGGGSDGGSCPAGQTWTCNTAKLPLVCGCK